MCMSGEVGDANGGGGFPDREKEMGRGGELSEYSGERVYEA